MLGLLGLIFTLLICFVAMVCAFVAKWFGQKSGLDGEKSFSLGLLLGPLGVLFVVAMSAKSTR